MEFEQLLQLIDKVSGSELTNFDYETEGVKIRLEKEKEVVDAAAQQPLTVQTKVPDNVAETKEDNENNPLGEAVVSPLVGVFYAAPAEDAAPYVAVGDKVKKGQTLAIVEAMKLMNEIESEYDGEIAEICVKNGQPVEYGQPLFRII